MRVGLPQSLCLSRLCPTGMLPTMAWHNASTIFMTYLFLYADLKANTNLPVTEALFLHTGFQPLSQGPWYVKKCRAHAALCSSGNKQTPCERTRHLTPSSLPLQN